MEIITTENKENITLAVSGKLNTAVSGQFQRALLSAIEKTRDVILDLEKVDYIASAGLGALLLAQKNAKENGAKITVIKVPDEIMRVFDITGFSKFLTIL